MRKLRTEARTSRRIFRRSSSGSILGPSPSMRNMPPAPRRYGCRAGTGGGGQRGGLRACARRAAAFPAPRGGASWGRGAVGLVASLPPGEAALPLGAPTEP